MTHGLAVSAGLFALGLAALLSRRNAFFMLLAVEVMLNAAGLAFVTVGAHYGQADGQVMFLFILTMAAAEVSVGLALALRLRRDLGTVDADATDHLGEGR